MVIIVCCFILFEWCVFICVRATFVVCKVVRNFLNSINWMTKDVHANVAMSENEHFGKFNKNG